MNVISKISLFIQTLNLMLDFDLGVKRVEKHVVRAKPLGGVDSGYEEWIL